MTAQRIGYARTSTLDQKAGLEAQHRDLTAAGCERIFSEQVSSVDVAERHQLEEALAYLRAGDTLVVTKLDRLARSVPHLLAVVDRLERKGASLDVLSGFGAGLETPTGKMLLTILGAVAEFERGIMLERQREGVAKAKAREDSPYKGRVPTAMRQADKIRALDAAGKTRKAIAAELGVSERSVYRALAGGEEEARA